MGTPYIRILSDALSLACGTIVNKGPLTAKAHSCVTTAKLNSRSVVK